MADLLRADRIVNHPSFKEAMDTISRMEEDRIYCRHGLEHLMDVARSGCILIEEEGLDIKADIMYGTALVHDLGRAMEYTQGTPHDQGSVIYAQKILPECGYSDNETAQIVMAVAAHRIENSGMPLGDILYEADKKSRLCFACEARDTCKWPEEKMNLELTV